MKRLFILTLLIFAVLLAATTQAFAAQASGTLYFLEGGRAGGNFHLYTKSGLLKVEYESSQLNFKDMRGYDYGAIWNISYYRAGSKLVLERAVFTGNFNYDVLSADRLIRRHYRLLAYNRPEEAYGNLSPAWKKSQSLNSFIQGYRKMSLTSGADTPPTFALKVIGQNSGGVLVLVDTSWFLKGGSYYRFDVIKLNGKYYIDRVDPISARDWENS